MDYDGTTPLQPALAELVGLSAKSQAQLAVLVKEAKASLGITSTARILPPEQRLAIYQWHKDRLKPVQDIKQDEAPNLEGQPDSPVYNVKQGNGVNSIHNVKQDGLEQVDGGCADNVVYNVKQDGDGDAVYDFKQTHFAIRLPDGKRTTTMLEGYLIDAMQQKHGLTTNGGIRAWIEQAIKNDGARFDSHAPLARQVKRLIIESLI
ncbi:hypothetical protein [Methyloglobulus sp.]|uniref:hypothetical protein n=1 Tax=Methyloglobulus sp. TaxID=2518622 RepID=UPI0032B81E0C